LLIVFLLCQVVGHLGAIRSLGAPTCLAQIVSIGDALADGLA